MTSKEARSLDAATERRHRAGGPYGVPPSSKPAPLPAWGPAVPPLQGAGFPKRRIFNELSAFVLEQGTRRHYMASWQMPLPDAEYQAKLAELQRRYADVWGEEMDVCSPESAFQRWQRGEW